MTKPEDIPQNIWDRVEALPIHGDGFCDDGDMETIARAILSAVEEEREALPDEIDLYRFLKNNRLRKRSDIAKAVASAIRNRKEG